jgi:hypothetical protein
MARVLTGDHAEDVGGIIVEPGQEIPSDADLEVIERLDDEGRLGDPKPAEQSAKGKRGSD